MISNQATTAANMTGNLFQIFNLPKAGSSSYLFSDIIKVIGGESDIQTANGMADAFFNDGSKSLIDSTKLLNLLNASMGSADAAPSGMTDGLSGNYFISEDELSSFMNKLGIDETSGLSTGSSEIAVEITPAFLNKIKELLGSNKNSAAKNVFVTLAPEETKKPEQKTDTGSDDKTEDAEGTEKIQVIFKKVNDGNDIIAAPQQFLFNNQQQYIMPGGGSVENSGSAEGEIPGVIISGGSSQELPGKTASGANQPPANIVTGDASVNVPDTSETLQAQSAKPVDSAFKEILSAMAADDSQHNPPADLAQAAEKTSAGKITADEKAAVKTDADVIVNQQAENNADVNIKTETSKQNKTAGAAVKPAVMGEVQDKTPVEVSKPVNAEAAPVTETKTAPGEQKSATGGKTVPVETVTKGSEKAQVVSEKQADTVTAGNEKPVNNSAPAEKSNLKKSAPVAADNKNEQVPVKEDVKTASGTVQDSADANNASEPVENNNTKQQPKAEGTVKTRSSEKNSVQADTSKRADNKQSVSNREDTVNTAAEDDSYYEPDMVFRFSNRVGSEMIKRNFSSNFNTRDAAGGDNSKFYQISIEKTRSEAQYNEKVMPQDFNTSDYENLSSGIFGSKMSDSIKEYKDNGKAPDTVKNNTVAANDSKEGSSSREQASTGMGSNNNNNTDTGAKQSAGKAPVDTAPFASHVQSKTASLDETSAAKPVKSYTSGFKEIDAAKLIDEIKNLSLKGEKTNITLKLSPENLGTVKLSIDMKESVMTTSIEVENESVKQVVQNNIDSLRQTLQQNGIQLSSFSVSLSQQHEQKTPGKSGGKKEKYQENDEVKSAAGEKKTKSKKMGYNTYEYLA